MTDGIHWRVTFEVMVRDRVTPQRLAALIGQAIRSWDSRRVTGTGRAVTVDVWIGPTSYERVAATAAEQVYQQIHRALEDGGVVGFSVIRSRPQRQQPPGD